MKLMQNTTIRNRLLWIFAIWICLFSLFGFFALRQMASLKKVTHDIYEHKIRAASAPHQVHIDVIKMHRAMKEFILADTYLMQQQWIHKMNELEGEIFRNLDEIRREAQGEERALEEQIREGFMAWRSGREQVIELAVQGNIQEANLISRTTNEEHVRLLEEKLEQLSLYIENRADDLVQQADSMEKAQEKALVVSMTLATILSLILFFTTTKSILLPIALLKRAMAKSNHPEEMEEVKIKGKNEITDMATHYNQLIAKLKEQFILKDRQNELSSLLSGNITLSQLTQRATQYLAEVMDCGHGSFYVYDEEKKILRLSGTFAFTDQDQLRANIPLGKGNIGQVALQKKPILLKNITEEMGIDGGLVQGLPLQVYAFPLIYENQLYGVMALSSFEAFTPLKQKLIHELAGVISINLYACLQNEKIKNLLQVAEYAKKEAQETADLLQKVNEALEEQRDLLKQQTIELQKTNAQLEEQQRALEQQSAELQQSNAELEEKQQLLEDQSRLLNIQNQSLERSKEELELSNRYKSEFLANMSHELRTPLNSILLLSRLLLSQGEQKGDEGQLEKLNIIHQAGKELLRLINDILDLSKIESGKMEVDRIEFTTQELVGELEGMFKEIAREKKLDFRVMDLVEGQMIGDKNKIAQILRNFLANAFKFTEKGGVKLIVKKEEKGNRVAFMVEDTGIGIPKEEQDRIFKAFRQVDGSITRKYGGTGLGLTIAQKLAKIMEGEIRVISEKGIGSTFSLHLEGILLENAHPIKEQSLAEVALTVEKLTYGGREKVILIIEDDLSFAQSIAKINEKMGFSTLLATTGREGLKQAKDHRVDGILLDLGLPDMSGLELLKELKQTKELKQIPVHIISAWKKDMRAQKMGAIGFDQKPVFEENIIHALGKMTQFWNESAKELLFIEDRKSNNQEVKKDIKDQGIHLTSVYTEAGAISEISKGIYHAIVLDLEMSEGNPLEILKYMEGEKIEIPVLLRAKEPLSEKEEEALGKYRENMILKTIDTNERLLDEISLFLHRVRKKQMVDGFTLPEVLEDGGSLEGKTILVVDDDPRNIFVMVTVLENLGATVHDAENGEVALEKLQELRPHLILMDIMMPIMNGYEAIEAIRKREALRQIPIIALTARVLEDDRQRCIEAGANDYITKPVDYDALIRIIKAWVDKH